MSTIERRMTLRGLVAKHLPTGSPVEIVAAIEAQVAEWVAAEVRAADRSRDHYALEDCDWCDHKNYSHHRCVHCDCTGPTAIAAHVALPEDPYLHPNAAAPVVIRYRCDTLECPIDQFTEALPLRPESQNPCFCPDCGHLGTRLRTSPEQ